MVDFRTAPASSPVGLHRVLEPAGVLPQAALRLDPSLPLWPDEVLVAVERLNLDAASFRQLSDKHAGDGDAVRAEVEQIVSTRGKMHNPVTGSGGMLVGTVQQAGPDSPLGLRPGERVATLVSLTLTPLRLPAGLPDWDGRDEQVPCQGQAILFGRSVAARLPEDLPARVVLAVLDVCGAPALTRRVVTEHRERGRARRAPVVVVIGAAGKSGSLALAAAREAGERDALVAAGLADVVVLADARDPVSLSEAVAAAGGPAEVTVLCVNVPGCEHGAILATAQRGTVIFFSMATSFPAAALGAEGLAADVTLLIGNGYVTGHADYALELLRRTPAVRGLLDARVDEPTPSAGRRPVYEPVREPPRERAGARASARQGRRRPR